MMAMDKLQTAWYSLQISLLSPSKVIYSASTCESALKLRKYLICIKVRLKNTNLKEVVGTNIIYVKFSLAVRRDLISCCPLLWDLVQSRISWRMSMCRLFLRETPANQWGWIMRWMEFAIAFITSPDLRCGLTTWKMRRKTMFKRQQIYSTQSHIFSVCHPI